MQDLLCIVEDEMLVIISDKRERMESSDLNKKLDKTSKDYQKDNRVDYCVKHAPDKQRGKRPQDPVQAPVMDRYLKWLQESNAPPYSGPTSHSRLPNR